MEKGEKKSSWSYFQKVSLLKHYLNQLFKTSFFFFINFKKINLVYGCKHGLNMMIFLGPKIIWYKLSLVLLPRYINHKSWADSWNCPFRVRFFGLKNMKNCYIYYNKQMYSYTHKSWIWFTPIKGRFLNSCKNEIFFTPFWLLII